MRKLLPVLGLAFAALTAMLAFGCDGGLPLPISIPILEPCVREDFGSLLLINGPVDDGPARVLIRDVSGTTVAESEVGNGASVTIQLQPGSYSLTAFWPLVPKTRDRNFSIVQCGTKTLII